MTMLDRVTEKKRTKLLGPPAKKEKIRQPLRLDHWYRYQYTPCSIHNAIHCNVYSIQHHKSELLTNKNFSITILFKSSSAAFYGLHLLSVEMYDMHRDIVTHSSVQSK